MRISIQIHEITISTINLKLLDFGYECQTKTPHA